jgi:dynein intermediate chain 3, axonemal
MEGVGELSLCKVCSSSTLPTAISSESSLLGDVRSHLMVSTEEGDVIFADLCGRKSNSSDNISVKEEKEKDEEEDSESSREYVRWISSDHSRPCVGLQQSPYFPDILLSVGDWNFHIWRVS